MVFVELVQCGVVCIVDVDLVVRGDFEEVDGIGWYCQQFVDQVMVQVKVGGIEGQGQGYGGCFRERVLF